MGRENISLAYPHFVAGTASSGQVCCATLGREVYTWGKPDGAFDSDRLRPKTFLWGATTVTDLMAFDTAISTKALTENRLVCVCVACCVLGVKAPGLSIFRAKTITQNRKSGSKGSVYAVSTANCCPSPHTALLSQYHLPLHSTTPAII